MADSRSKDLNGEVFGCKQVNALWCETCIFAETREPFGRLPKLGVCKVFKSKPEEVLFDGARCEFYEQEKRRK